VGDLLVEAVLRVERRVAGIRRVRRGVVACVGGATGVDGRVSIAHSLAVLGEAVVVGEREVPVLARVEELHPVEQVAVRLEHIQIVLLRMAHGHVLEHESVRAVDLERDVLLRADAARALVSGRGLAGVHHHVLRLRSRPLDLEVAPHARAEVRDAVPIRLGRRWGALARPAAEHVDERLVVGAVPLVAVGEPHRPPAAEVGVGEVLVALGVEGRLLARVGLGVDPGHDDDEVVVVRVEDGPLNRVVGAAPRELLVQVPQVVGGRRAEPVSGGRGPQLEAVGLRVANRLARQGQRTRLTDHQRVPGERLVERGAKRAGRGHLAASRWAHAMIRLGVRPVGRALDMSVDERRRREQHRGDADRQRGDAPTHPSLSASPGHLGRCGRRPT
jgi:hypothetical protein